MNHSSRREAVVAKFRATAATRLRALASPLGDIARGSATPDQYEEVHRALHTIKGEANMLGFGDVAQLAHAAEELVRGEAWAGAVEGALRVLETVDVMVQWLREELGDEATAAAVLAAQRAKLTVLDPADAAKAASAPATEAGVASPAAPRADKPAGRAVERWVQVDASRVDALCERISEFESRYRSIYFRARAMSRERVSNLDALVVELDRCQAELEEVTSMAWSLRVVPLEPLLSELAAHARSLATTQGKAVHVVLEGGNVEVERTVLEALFEPLLHVVRNAIDHGIESEQERGMKGPAYLWLHAEPVGPNAVITIRDNGRGIDRANVLEAAMRRGLIPADVAAPSDGDVLELLFAHGFSTRDEVTEVSGRGVGLDIVRNRVDAVGGSVHLESEAGQGSTFVITLPSRISKEPNLVVDAGHGLYAIPSRAVRGLARLAEQKVEEVAGARIVRWEGASLPLLSLDRVLGRDEVREEPWIVVLGATSFGFAFTIPKPLGEFTLLRRPHDRLVALAPFLSASATFEDGRLVLILSVAGLLERARRHTPTTPATKPRGRATSLLVVDDSAIVRELLVELLGGAEFDVRAAAGGEEALAMLADAPPDAVLLDIDMPRMDGFEVLRRIRAISKRLPVIMLSLRSSADDQSRAASLGASAYIVKSQFQETTLVDTIRRFVGAAPA